METSLEKPPTYCKCRKIIAYNPENKTWSHVAKKGDEVKYCYHADMILSEDKRAKAFPEILAKLTVRDNAEAAVLQIALYQYIDSGQGATRHQDSAKRLLKRLNKNLNKDRIIK